MFFGLRVQTLKCSLTVTLDMLYRSGGKKHTKTPELERKSEQRRNRSTLTPPAYRLTSFRTNSARSSDISGGICTKSGHSLPAGRLTSSNNPRSRCGDPLVFFILSISLRTTEGFKNKKCLKAIQKSFVTKVSRVAKALTQR